ncbi:squalene/phytoene synthase family protein [Paenibacillus protaetiae]|uniref:Phytoene/squalene synthase family protein n=1 Tax=Paenibacillus protaetiae TaxID=2509456 RepID=A0A4P6EZ62_9BACL|nr:phytoene/squalene synthase family protein [Paenibacillus protaetiae]QAY68374.1 phytoene/squalene synthase family protein [Paenibacillus protaetiae]
MTMLQQTSRTFFIPISRLEQGLKEAVGAAYLCMRAIDEIEDHEQIPDHLKTELLYGVHDTIKASPSVSDGIKNLLAPHKDILPAVSLRLPEWMQLCPSSIMETVNHYTAKMSKLMADWVGKKWTIRTEEDLDGYTYSVAGLVGEMLSDLWMWYDKTDSDREKAVAFGRGLQAVNILRNRKEDLERGVDFFPDGWGMKEMLAYTRRNLKLADEYTKELKKGPAKDFCKIPLALAHATVKIISIGGNKLTRDMVLKIVNKM